MNPESIKMFNDFNESLNKKSSFIQFYNDVAKFYYNCIDNDSKDKDTIEILAKERFKEHFKKNIENLIVWSLDYSYDISRYSIKIPFDLFKTRDEMYSFIQKYGNTKEKAH